MEDAISIKKFLENVNLHRSFNLPHKGSDYSYEEGQDENGLMYCKMTGPNIGKIKYDAPEIEYCRFQMLRHIFCRGLFTPPDLRIPEQYRTQPHLNESEQDGGN